MNCQYCNREIKNKGSLKAHEMCCKMNPDKVTHKHSEKAGAQKGCVPWNSGKTFQDKVLERVITVVESNQLSNYCEPAARRTAKQ